jgi:immune inhibitor A
MEAGSWNGILGGMQPAPFPLFFRYLVGWADPEEFDYTTKPALVKVGQLSRRPWGTEQGIKINLPDQVIDIANRAGTGKAWWSDRSDLADFYLAHTFDLAGTTAPVFSFNSYWSFEADYDYGYFEVSTDSGATWTKLDDMDAFFVDDGSGNLGLNGEGQDTLRFDLKAYAGKAITLRLHYTSDVGVQWDGWWADDFSLVDGATTLFTDDVEAGTGTWETNNFVLVPLTRIFPMYYLAEWRNMSGFDRGLAYPYSTVYNNDATTEWEVDRCPYTVPGMLLWLRNGAQDFDYTLFNSIYDSPSWGPKHALLVVDSHYWPLEWEGMSSTSPGAHLRANSRCQPGNATFTLQKTTSYTLRRVDSTSTGNVVETKTFERLPGVSQFHDSLGYYPGFRYHIPAPDEDPDNEGLWWWDSQASLAVPALGDYTTRVTWDDKTPAPDLYGFDIGGTILGTGNPGDAGVQYGLHLAVVGKEKHGKWGLIKVWNSSQVTDLTIRSHPEVVRPGRLIAYALKITNKTPVFQSFELNDAIPEYTTFFRGMFYDHETNSIHWKGKLAPYETKVVAFLVKVGKDTLKDTIIINEAYLTDEALGDIATVETIVK